VHLGSLGPGPFAAMLLADLGCDVVVVDRVDDKMARSSPPDKDPRRRSQRSIRIDLKHPRARPVLELLIRRADVLVEGMRPGVAERLGLGPEDCSRFNPRLVYARMTGWGQDGPLADRAGHDINYVAASGALFAMGDPDRPPPVPLNLLGDYAGGGAYLVLGVVAALFRRERDGGGEVIDAAIVDGVASLTSAAFGMLAAGAPSGRGTNLFDGSAPFYRTYEARDGGFVAVGALEAQFYEQMLERMGLPLAEWPQADRSRWPDLTERLAREFRSRDRLDWERIFAGSDACVTAVVSFDEAPRQSHHVQRATYVEAGGVVQPAPAPRFERSPLASPRPSPRPGRDTDAVLADLGLTVAEIDALRAAGAVA